MSMMRSVWESLEEELRRFAPKHLTYLRVGATSERIAAAEHSLSCRFPNDLRQSLEIHDGCLRGQNSENVLIVFELYDCERIVAATLELRTEQMVNRPFEERGGWKESCLMIGASPAGWQLVADTTDGRVFVYVCNNYAIAIAMSFSSYMEGLLFNLRAGTFTSYADGTITMEDWGEHFG
jgi:hypothetical protein